MNHLHPVDTELYRRGRYREFLAACRPADSRLTPPLRVMAAEASFFCGDTNAAVALSAAQGDDDSVRTVRPRFEVVRGLASRGLGDFDAALHHFNVAVRLALEVGNPIDIAWCELRRFRALVDGGKESEIAANLSNVRRWVSRAGEARLTALLHDTVAVLEGQAGRRDEARRHLEIARSILSQHPHAWVEFSVHTNAFCLAWLTCDYGEAERHLRRARHAGALVGGSKADDVTELNRAHLSLATGELESAFAALSKLLAGPKRLEQLAAIDGLGRLHLALGHYRECEETFALNWSVDRTQIDSYVLRWARTSEVAFAIRIGKFREAIDAANCELKRARARGDLPFLASLLVLQAEAFSALGNASGASHALLKTTELDVRGTRQQQGEAYSVAGKILAYAGIPFASLFLSRARRVWRREQNIWAQLASADLREFQLPIAKYTQRDVDRLIPDIRVSAPSTVQDAATVVLNRVVAAFEQSFDATLAGEELKSIADATGCSAQVTFRISNVARNSANEEGCTARLISERGGDLVMRCTPSADLGGTVAAADLLALVRKLNELARLRREEARRAALWPTLYEQNDEDLFISEEMTLLAATARKIAPTNVPVLITGETGTGKEILARAIHAASTRTRGFVPFNCSTGSREMIDAQLFGHRRGAFTGATEHAPGVIRAAAGGTLFLDEIGEAPVEVQPKLLRFLESGEIHPVGEPLPAKVDVRVIAATNVDLDAAVSSGRFREDLFYRLNIVRLHLPPLRERRVEIPVFAQHYLKKYAGELGKGDFRLAEETVEYLLLYRWPGNVRQLANEMRRMAALAEADAVLMPEHLSPDIVASRRTVPASERTLDPNELVVRMDQPLAAVMEHVERAMIPYALGLCEGRVEDAARKLGLSRKGLYLKRMRLGVEAAAPHERTA